MVDEESKAYCWDDEELRPESVMVGIIGSLELHKHEVEGGVGRHQEDHLHHSVVDGDEVDGQVQVPCREHQCKQHLALPGYACRG